MDVATLLRRCRLDAGLTQRELAARAGTSAAAICFYERGERVPRTDTLVRLVAAAGATLDWCAVPATDGVDLVRNGRVLVEVLELAEALPHRRPPDELDLPPFASLAR